jgi:hypothetical protein
MTGWIPWSFFPLDDLTEYLARTLFAFFTRKGDICSYHSQDNLDSQETKKRNNDAPHLKAGMEDDRRNINVCLRVYILIIF